MRQMKMWGSAALLGASLALGACGGGNDAATDQSAGTAAGEVAPGATAGATGGAAGGAMGGATDSGAMAGGDMNELASMSPPDVMALVGASNAAEIGTSQLATDKATNADVKAFARRMIQEHQAMQGQADQLATRLNVTPGTPDRAQQKTEMANQMTEQLRGAARGQAFDRMYMDGQVQAHQQTLAELQGMQNTANADVKALIQKAIPKVQAHLDEGTRLQGQLGGAGATGGNSGAAGATSGAAGGTTGATGTGGTTPSPR